MGTHIVQLIAEVLKKNNGDVAQTATELLNLVQGAKQGKGPAAQEEEEEEEGEEVIGIDTSVVRLYGENTHSCGYCKSEDPTNVSYGMVATKMLVEDYEELMNAGAHCQPHPRAL